MLIFPQGTRQAIDQPMSFQPAGVAALYTNLDVPVLPTAHNSGLFWQEDADDPQRQYHAVLSAAIPPGLDRKAFQAEVERVIAAEAGRFWGCRREALTASRSGGGASLSRDSKVRKQPHAQ